MFNDLYWIPKSYLLLSIGLVTLVADWMGAREFSSSIEIDLSTHLEYHILPFAFGGCGARDCALLDEKLDSTS